LIIAIASTGPDPDAPVSAQAARAPYYLLFDAQGEMVEALGNPYADTGHGAAPKAAALLAEKGVDELLAGEFGSRLLEELQARGIAYRSTEGRCRDRIVERVKG
jgi:predicted Fe-Mo cluster-binding NifX family protein